MSSKEFAANRAHAASLRERLRARSSSARGTKHAEIRSIRDAKSIRGGGVRKRARPRSLSSIATSTAPSTSIHQLSSGEASAGCPHCLYGLRTGRAPAIIASGVYAYIALPVRLPVTEGHLCIVSTAHVSARTDAEVGLIEEIERFKRVLKQCYEEVHRMKILFYESAFARNMKHRHLVIDVIPLKTEDFSVAEGLFRQAMREGRDGEDESIGVIKDVDTGGVAKAAPKGLAYFAVEFGTEKGIVMMIENNKTFDRYWGDKVVEGVLQVEEKLGRATRPPLQEEQHALMNVKKEFSKISELFAKSIF